MAIIKGIVAFKCPAVIFLTAIEAVVRDLIFSRLLGDFTHNFVVVNDAVNVAFFDTFKALTLPVVSGFAVVPAVV
jgi:hypothetical protein